MNLPSAEWQTDFFQRQPHPEGWNSLYAGAKRAYYFADEEARLVESPLVQTEHFLLALLREEDTGAAFVLHEAGRDREQLRRQTLEATKQNADTRDNHVFGARKIILHNETSSALRRSYYAPIGSAYVGTTALLFGLLTAGKSVARDILWANDGDLERLLRIIESSSLEELIPFEERAVPAMGVRRKFADIDVQQIDHVLLDGKEIRKPDLLSKFLSAMQNAVQVPEILQCFMTEFSVQLKNKQGKKDELIRYEYHHDGRDSFGRQFAEFVRLVGKMK